MAVTTPEPSQLLTAQAMQDEGDRRSFVPGALPLLTVYLVLLYGLPSNATIAALGSMGRPSVIFGLVCLLWWGWLWLVRSEQFHRPWQPVRIAFLAFMTTIGAGYALAHAGGMPLDEISPSDSALLRSLSWAGVLLLANDGLDAQSLTTLLRRLVLLGGLVAALGVVQFISGQTLIDQVPIPGLAADYTMAGTDVRGDFTRASATATHPLEYAVVLAATLPVAIALGFSDTTRGVVRRWWATAVVAFASLVSLSRSALVGLVVSTAVLLPALPRAARSMVVAGGAAILAAAFVTIPGLIGTIRGMFLAVGQDPSSASRASASDVVLDIAGNYGPLGRGFGTFLPKYVIVDNQFLILLTDVGIVGLLSFLALIVTAIVVAQRARRRVQDAALSLLVHAVTAALVATVCLFGFFDALGFPMAAGTLFLLLGVIGAAGNVPGPSIHDDPEPSKAEAGPAGRAAAGA